MSRHAQLDAVRERIARAEAEAHRAAGSVTLVAVSKTFQAEDIAPVIAAGQRVFGENRVQEAKAKWPALMETTPGISLHLIGPLQTNKVKEAVQTFDCIHTLDRPRLAEALAGELARTARRPMLFVQVNTGAEDQKAGVAPEQADGFIALCRKLHAEGREIIVRGDGPGMARLPEWILVKSSHVEPADCIRDYWEAEAHLVAGHPDLPDAVFPSKFWNAHATGRPVLASGFDGVMAAELETARTSDFRQHLVQWSAFLLQLVDSARTAGR